MSPTRQDEKCFLPPFCQNPIPVLPSRAACLTLVENVATPDNRRFFFFKSDQMSESSIADVLFLHGRKKEKERFLKVSMPTCNFHEICMSCERPNVGRRYCVHSAPSAHNFYFVRLRNFYIICISLLEPGCAGSPLQSCFKSPPGLYCGVSLHCLFSFHGCFSTFKLPPARRPRVMCVIKMLCNSPGESRFLPVLDLLCRTLVSGHQVGTTRS